MEMTDDVKTKETNSSDFPRDKIEQASKDCLSNAGPIRLFNPIIGVSNGKPKLLWSTDAIGRSISTAHFDTPEIGSCVYRQFKRKNKKILCLADFDLAVLGEKLVEIHTEIGALGVRKALPTKMDKETDKKVLDKARWEAFKRNYFATPSDEASAPTTWYSLFRALDLEEMGMSTNLSKLGAKTLEDQPMYALDLEQFLKEHPFGKNEPLVADWDYGLETLEDIRQAMIGIKAKTAAIEMAELYGGPPAKDKFHVDLKLNPLWISNHRDRHQPDPNWYKDTLDKKLKETSHLWTELAK